MGIVFSGLGLLVGGIWLLALRDARYAMGIEALHDEDLELVSPPVGFVRWRRDSELGETDPNDVLLLHNGYPIVRITFTSDDMHSIEEIGVNDSLGESWIWAKPALRTYTVQKVNTNQESGHEDRSFVNDTDGDAYPDQVILWLEGRVDRYKINCSREGASTEPN